MKNFFFILMLTFIHASMNAQSDVATARWANTPVIVDGENTEWGSPNFYDDDTRLSFGIANDSNNIYLCFESTDEPTQMKIMRAGMKVILSAKGKSKHDAVIEFPIPQNTKKLQHEQLPLDDSMDNNNASYTHRVHDASSFRQYFITNHKLMNVSGFASANGEIPIDSINSLRAAINWDSASNFYYEIAIAKKEFFGADYSAKDASADITLNVEINALPQSSHEGMGGGGYHGGYHGGGMNGGGSHFNRSHDDNEETSQEKQNMEAERAALSVKTSFKQKFVLNNNSSE